MLMGKNILVVDDEQMIVELVSSVLETLGATVWSATNPKEGLHLLRIHSIRYIILDRQMPDLDGIGFLNIIKNDPLTENIPVIMLTAANKNLEITEALAVGASGYLIKPFKPVDLANQLKNIIDKENTWKV